MPLIAPGACGSRLTLSGETTVYTVMNNFKDQVPEVTIPYEFDAGFTQEVQIAYPIQIRFPDLAARPPDSKHSLSTGAIVGIAFGGFFSLFFCGLIWFLLLRWRRKNSGTAVPDNGLGSSVPEVVQPSIPSGYPVSMGESLYNSTMVPEYGPGSPLQMQRKPIPQRNWGERVSLRLQGYPISADWLFSTGHGALRDALFNGSSSRGVIRIAETMLSHWRPGIPNKKCPKD